MVRNRYLGQTFGIASAIAQALAEEVYRLGGDDDDLARIVSDQPLAARLAKAIVTRDGRPLTHRMTVQPASMIASVIAAGRYASPYSASEDVLAPFLALQDGRTDPYEVDLEIVRIDKAMNVQQVNRELAKRGLRPGTLMELLAIGERCPELQKKIMLVALGSCVPREDGFLVPSLCASSAGSSHPERRIHVELMPHGMKWWKDHAAFIAARTQG